MDFNGLKNKKILVVIPHQDDEIHVAGGVIEKFHNNNDIYVCFTTNGDYVIPAKYRYKEAIKSLKKLGVEKNKVYFLGYCDQSYSGITHMYTSKKDWTSKNNISETYGVVGIDEWCYIKNHIHNKLNINNLINDLRELIEFITPDIIVTNDLDFHPDHIMTALSVEKAINLILKNKGNYYPLLLKTFTYENSYFGPFDFNQLYPGESIFKTKDKLLLHNKYFSEEECLKIKINEKFYTLNLFKNVAYKAIKCHKSQVLTEHAFNMINCNFTYIPRFTNNLMYLANIETSSGQKEYLNDFILCDSSNILNGNNVNINYDQGIWIPEKNDDKKNIKIFFSDFVKVKYMVFYHGLNNENIKNIEVKYNGKIIKHKFNNLLKKERILIDDSVKTIEIKILDNVVKNGFSEIELYDSIPSIKSNKVLLNDKWTNNYICFKDEKVKISIYSYEKKDNNFDIDLSYSKNVGYDKGNLLLSNKSKGFIIVKGNNFNEKIFINKNKCLNDINIIINPLLNKVNIIIDKFYRKFFVRKW